MDQQPKAITMISSNHSSSSIATTASSGACSSSFSSSPSSSSYSPATSPLAFLYSPSCPLSPPSLSSSSPAYYYATQHHDDDEELLLINNLLDEASLFLKTNMICICILIVYRVTQHLVLGTLRVSEHQHIKEAFWDYFLQKSLFILFILEAELDKLHWTIWSTCLGSVALLTLGCKDRFEYLSSSPSAKRWSLLKISILLGILLLFTVLINALVFIDQPDDSTAVLFLLADSVYILTFVISVITRCLVLTYDMRTNSVWETRASVIYYGDLIFALIMSTIDLLHHSHILIINTSIMIKACCAVKINTLVMEIRKRYKRHKHYLLVVNLMDTNFPMASKEDLDKNSDDCAICWDEMSSARKLPCSHLFHNSCLRSWLEQDTSCPTCRTSLKRPSSHEDHLSNVENDVGQDSESEDEFIEATTRGNQRNHFFHFDSSRYTNHPLLSWLPTISIEGFM